MIVAEFYVTAPDGEFAGDVAGVRFSGGSAVADGVRDRAALAYFRRRGYTVEPVEVDGSGEAPSVPVGRPKSGDPKANWVAYAVASTDLTEAEADDLTKADLIALADE